MAKLQIELQGDVTGDGKPEFKVTPIDVALPDNVAKELSRALAVADQFDAEPGDGEFDQNFKSKVPVRFRLFGVAVGRDVDIDGKVTLRIKE